MYNQFMAITSKLTLRYQRQAGFPGYSHVQMETVEEVMLEAGDDARLVEASTYEAIARNMAERIEPIAATYRKVNVPESPQNPGKAGRSAGGVAKEPPRAAAEPAQREMPELAVMPATREQGRAAPRYDKKGGRVRTVETRSFVQLEINSAWQALFDFKAIAESPDTGRGGNEGRTAMRKWLLNSPLDPGFSQEELQLVAAQYAKYRAAAMTSTEAMMEVANDYGAKFGNAPAGSDPAQPKEDTGPDQPGDQGTGELDGTADAGVETEPGASDGEPV